MDKQEHLHAKIVDHNMGFFRPKLYLDRLQPNITTTIDRLR